ncbi:MAG: hypothetical protein LQ338_003415 [Usnochroma carphineum]|nr:MAG: hypothetical protein LQ338_003415 [Usnochroma carphineum]
MDLLSELEDLATEAIKYDEKPSAEQVKRWQKLFGYAEGEAVDQITAHRLDLNRRKLSDEQWELIKAETEAEGYDKEAYEHKLQLSMMISTQPAVSEDTDTFVFKRGGPLRNLEDLQNAIGYPVGVLQGSSRDGEASFVKVNGATKRAIERWLEAKVGCDYRPNFVRLSMAKKDLSNNSMHPVLGLETTLPHRRAQHQSGIVMQNQYPVWYFFYGTLAEDGGGKLMDLLSLEESAQLVEATVEGGEVKSWGGKYKALVDGHPDASVPGWAYLVDSSEHEETLRCYESEKYEVVRCTITLRDERRIGGLTFRFAYPSLVDD